MYIIFWLCTHQNDFTDGNLDWYLDNPVDRFVASKHQYNRFVWPSTADDIDSSVTGWWRTSVDNLVHSQNVDFVPCRTILRSTTVDCLALLFIITWIGKGWIIIREYLTSICISWRNVKVVIRYIINIYQENTWAGMKTGKIVVLIRRNISPDLTRSWCQHNFFFVSFFFRRRIIRLLTWVIHLVIYCEPALIKLSEPDSKDTLKKPLLSASCNAR